MAFNTLFMFQVSKGGSSVGGSCEVFDWLSQETREAVTAMLSSGSTAHLWPHSQSATLAGDYATALEP